MVLILIIIYECLISERRAPELINKFIIRFTSSFSKLVHTYKLSGRVVLNSAQLTKSRFCQIDENVALMSFVFELPTTQFSTNYSQ